MKWFLLAACALAASAQNRSFDCISPDNLRGRVSFLASDLLAGRDTPSPGLDAAANYIAGEFQRAGLESPPGLHYFQTAVFEQVTDRGESFQFLLAGPKKSAVSVAPEHITLLGFETAHLANEPVFKWTPKLKLDGPLTGTVLLLRLPADPHTIASLELAHPDAIVLIIDKPGGNGWRSDLLVPRDTIRTGTPAMLTVPAADMQEAFDRMRPGLTTARVTINALAPIRSETNLRNVVGVLPGSDPTLTRQTILISAHYDHLGVAEFGKDRIYNGANDNASGVATVIELAAALAGEQPHPKRTLVFLCFFGEEKGLLGSRYYEHHPLFPLASTIADINFEQMGIPSPKDGLPAGSIGVTGYDFSNMPQWFAHAAKVQRTRHNEDYFARSDNLSFAQAGIPSHTFVAAYEFPQYHQVSDEWRNLDYDNMATIDRELASAILDLADRADVPHWTDAPQAKPFQNAWRALHP